jgi:hypothetical protein
LRRIEKKADHTLSESELPINHNLAEYGNCLIPILAPSGSALLPYCIFVAIVVGLDFFIYKPSSNSDALATIRLL